MIKKGHRWRRNIEVNLNIKINIKINIKQIYTG